MQKYKNVGGDSGVEAFEIGVDFIEVKFAKTIKTYKYSYESAGKEAVEHMKKLALRGMCSFGLLEKYISAEISNKQLIFQPKLRIICLKT
ncbi:MAG: hypothetical protein J6B90_08795 [Lachnospiraceae bacterium]|nr:hypothetical protein [Lachnospiraceae bacterium]